MYSMSTRDGQLGDFHLQDPKINVFADSVVVEAIVGIRQEQL